MFHYQLKILRLIVNRISRLGYNIEDTINKIFQVCWLLKEWLPSWWLGWADVVGS